MIEAGVGILIDEKAGLISGGSRIQELVSWAAYLSRGAAGEDANDENSWGENG